jgi:hypothetical protein
VSAINEFSQLISDLSNNIAHNTDFFKETLKKNPTLVYYKLNELARFVGSRYNLVLEIHFPNSDEIYNVDEYGTKNLSIVIDKFRKTFPIPRENIKQKAIELFPDVSVFDAYMYEEKEGLRIILKESSLRIEILPGSLHLWTKINPEIEQFGNWLLSQVYQERIKTESQFQKNKEN